MPKIERSPSVGSGPSTPQIGASHATTPRPPVAGERSFPQSAVSSALGSRTKTSSVAWPRAHSFVPLRQGLSAAPGPVRSDRPRDIVAHNWQDRAGPWFEPREFQQMMQMLHGPDYRFRSHEYESDSEGSDFDDIPPTDLSSLDPHARAERFDRETASLFARHEDLLAQHRQASFGQSDFLKKFDPGSPGVCLALSVQWLQSAQAHPEQSMSQRLDFITSDQQAQRVLEMQDQSNRVHDELAFRTYYPLKELSETSAHLQGVEFSKYMTCKADQGATLSDVGLQAAMRLQHEQASKHHLLIPTPGAHAIACEKLDDGRFRLFEPNHGAYEVTEEQLSELLAGVLAKHLTLVKSIEDRNSRPGREVPISTLVAKTELRIIPVSISPRDPNPGAAARSG